MSVRLYRLNKKLSIVNDLSIEFQSVNVELL